MFEEYGHAQTMGLEYQTVKQSAANLFSPGACNFTCTGIANIAFKLTAKIAINLRWIIQVCPLLFILKK